VQNGSAHQEGLNVWRQLELPPRLEVVLRLTVKLLNDGKHQYMVRHNMSRHVGVVLQ
jgi:hypothetical protein